MRGMNAWIGWALAITALVVGWRQYGWPGLVFAFTCVVFWLLLQFNKAVRVMRNAGSAPIGYVDSAVMLNAKLKPGMPMLQVVMMTKSLGQKIDTPEAGLERFRWTDPGGSHVTLDLRGGKAVRWTLWRPQDADAQEPARAGDTAGGPHGTT